MLCGRMHGHDGAWPSEDWLFVQSVGGGFRLISTRPTLLPHTHSRGHDEAWPSGDRWSVEPAVRVLVPRSAAGRSPVAGSLGVVCPKKMRGSSLLGFGCPLIFQPPREGEKKCRRNSCRESEGVPRFLSFPLPPRMGARGLKLTKPVPII